MNETTAQILRDATRDFYARVQASFSQTRQTPWDGWVRIAEIIEHAQLQRAGQLKLLDVGCGNMRFEKFLAENLECELAATMLDACKFDGADFPGTFIQCDILNGLNQTLADCRDFDVTVAFGVMHHVPMQSARKQLLAEMIEHTRVGGIVAVSFWQPLQDGRIARNAKASTQRGCAQLGISLDASNAEESRDLLLGWKDQQDVYRYCRHFSYEEIKCHVQFCETQGCVLLEAIKPNEGSDKLNSYLILKKTVSA